MNASTPSLTYYTSDRLVRPASLTVATVLGIAASVLLGLALVLPGRALARGEDGNPNFAMACVLLVRGLFNVLMVIGCCGILQMRRSAARLTAVCAYAWLVSCTIEISLICHAASTNRFFTGMIIYITAGGLLLAMEGVLPVLLLVLLRRPNIQAILDRANARSAPPLTVMPLVSLIVLIGASLNLVNLTLQTLYALTSPAWDPYMAIDHSVGAFDDTRVGTLASLAIKFGTALLLLVGSILSLRRLPVGRTLMIVGSVMLLCITSTSPPFDGHFSRRISLPDFSGIAHMISWTFQDLALPAILLVILTYRAPILVQSPSGAADPH